MSSLQWYDGVRLLTAIFAFWTVYCLGRLHHRGHLDDGVINNAKRMRDFWWSLTAILLIVGIGNIENILRNRTPNLTLVPSVLALFVFLRATRKTRKIMERQHSKG